MAASDGASPAAANGRAPGGEPGRPQHDVAIIGVHTTTALLATILARQGVKVALVPSVADGTHPAGETTVPYTAELFFLLARRFGVPELADLGMFPQLPESVRRTSGVKRNLGFLYHWPGRPHDPGDALQFNVPGEHAEWHLYRPDVEPWLTGLATAAGAHLVPATAQDVLVGPTGATVLTSGGAVGAAFVVDGSGDPTIAAALSGSPGGAPPGGRAVRQQVRLLHTHLHGVRPFESLVPLERHGKANSWHAGTLLHAFPGGWLQVAPFGNHPDGVNSLASVSVSLPPDARGDDAESAFRALLARYPDLGRQFDRVIPTQPWRDVTDRPYGSTVCHGPRHLLFDRAAVRHDLLWGRDLTMGLELVHATAVALIDLARADAWGSPAAGSRISQVAWFQLDLFDYHDRLVAAARAATRDFALWNAFTRTWLLWSILSALALKRARLDGEVAGTAAGWAPLEHFDRGAFWFDVPDGLPELLDGILSDIERVEAGNSDARKAAASIFRRLRRSRIVPPLFAFGDPGARYYTFGPARRIRMLLWAKSVAPQQFRRLLTPDNVTAVPRAGGA